MWDIKSGVDNGQIKRKVNLGMPTTEWLSVYNLQPSLKQRYHYNIPHARLARHIKKGNKDGLFISSVASCSNLWTIIIDTGTGFTAQIFKVSPLFLHKEWILKHWKKYRISAIAGANNGTSLVVMSNGTQYKKQLYKVSESFPFEWINEKWREGFHVTSMATEGTKWAIVMSIGAAGFSDRVVELDPLPSTIQRRLDDGYRITSTAATSYQTAIVLSISIVKDPYESQDTLQTSAFSSRRIKGKWTRDLYVTSVCYGRGVS